MTRRLVLVWAIAATAAMLLTTVLALILGGGAPAAPPPGLPDPGRLPAWIDALLPVGTRITATLTVGFGLVACGIVGRPAQRTRMIARAAAWSWAGFVAIQMAVFNWSLDGRARWFDTTRGKALLIEFTVIITAVACWQSARRITTMAGGIVSVLGLLPSIYAGHVASSEHRLIAAAAISVHVIAATAWIGGLAALAWLALNRIDPWTAALPAFSKIALVSVIALTASGIAISAQRVEPAELFTSTYGAIIVLKTAVLGVLAVAGDLQRRHIRSEARPGRAFIALAGFELLTMTIAAGLATALASTPPPA